ncbi:MAG TPA: PEPxxWA-CTERM sorting domain-containing protein, partial [Phenylobacterium sp.]
DHTTPENVDSLRQVEITTTGGGVVRGGGGVPEPASWAMMILGFFGLGSALRARRRLSAIG